MIFRDVFREAREEGIKEGCILSIKDIMEVKNIYFSEKFYSEILWKETYSTLRQLRRVAITVQTEEEMRRLLEENGIYEDDKQTEK